MYRSEEGTGKGTFRLGMTVTPIDMEGTFMQSSGLDAKFPWAQELLSMFLLGTPRHRYCLFFIQALLRIVCLRHEQP